MVSTVTPGPFPSSPILPRSFSTTMRSLIRTTSLNSDEMNTTAIPCSTRPAILACTSTFAAMSMPRVGSSSTITSGRVANSRASSTFCCAPPLRYLAGRLTGTALRPKFSTDQRTSSSRSRRDTGCRQPRSAWRLSTMLSATERSPTMPRSARSSVDATTRRASAWRGESSLTRTPSILSSPPSARATPDSRAASSVRPDPRRPAKPTTSPR